jgi:hypothetical protein
MFTFVTVHSKIIFTAHACRPGLELLSRSSRSQFWVGGGSKVECISGTSVRIRTEFLNFCDAQNPNACMSAYLERNVASICSCVLLVYEDPAQKLHGFLYG